MRRARMPYHRSAPSPEPFTLACATARRAVIRLARRECRPDAATAARPSPFEKRPKPGARLTPLERGRTRHAA